MVDGTAHASFLPVERNVIVCAQHKFRTISRWLTTVSGKAEGLLFKFSIKMCHFQPDHCSHRRLELAQRVSIVEFISASKHDVLTVRCDPHWTCHQVTPGEKQD